MSLSVLRHAFPVALAAALLFGCDTPTTNDKKTDPTVTPVAVTSLTLDRNTIGLRVNETTNLTAWYTPATATVTTATWASSDTTVATVDSTGLVTAKKLGTAKITATMTDGSKSASANFTCGDLVVFSMSDEFKTQGVIADFETETGKKVALEVVPNDQYLSALKKKFSTGINVPDIFVGEAGFVKEVVNLGKSEDLAAAPYSAVTTDQYPYTVQLGKDEGGTLRALTWQATPGGMFYRRSIATAVFGTDDPAVIATKFNTWATSIESGTTLLTAGYKVLPGVNDLANVFFANKAAPYFDAAKKYTLDPMIGTYFDTAKKLRDANTDAKLDAWSADWMAGLNTSPGNAKIFSYLWPTWGLFFVLNGQPASKGDWAVTSGPSPWYWGGTWMSIASNSTNKTLAWQFVKKMTLDRTYMETYALRTGDFVNNKFVVDKIKGDYHNAVLGGQNHYAFFAQEAEKISAAGVSGADTVVNYLVNSVLKDYLDGKIATVDLALAEVTAQVKKRYPDATYP